MGNLTVKLLVDSYGQPTSREKDAEVTQRSKGEVFDAIDKAEYDRLHEIGAALDPKKAQEAEAADLERRRAALEAEKADLDAKLDKLQDPSKLSGKALDAALSERGLSTEGTADEKRQRLADAPAETT